MKDMTDQEVVKFGEPREMLVFGEQSVQTTSFITEWTEAQAKEPDWAGFDAERKHVHDWRSYVTREVRAHWDSIPLAGRCAVVACCEDAAGREHWE